MAKQKVVIKVCMNDKKSRSKAMKIAVGVSGVECAAIQGQDRDEIEVTGEGVDSVVLTSLLRKRFGHADLVSVGPVEKKDEKKKEENKDEPIMHLTWPYVSTVPHYPVYYYYPVYQYEDRSCSIM